LDPGFHAEAKKINSTPKPTKALLKDLNFDSHYISLGYPDFSSWVKNKDE